MDKKAIIKTIEEAIINSKKRNFRQTVDVAINFKNINFKQPQNRISLEVELPYPFMSKSKVLLFASDNNLIASIKDVVDKIIPLEEIPNISKKDAKKLARDYDLFFAEAKAMPIVGKYLGPILAPRGKMPKLAVPNKSALENIIKKSEKTIKVSNKKGKYLPTVHFAIGKEDMDKEQLYENFKTVFDRLLAVLPGKLQNIKSIYVKTTMGKAYSIDTKYLR